MIDSENGPRWYVAYTRPRLEFDTSANLRRDGFYTHCPYIKERRREKRRNGGFLIVWREVPLFARYVFVAVRAGQSIYDAKEVQGVVSIVSKADEPLVVPPLVMTEIMARGDAGGFVGTHDRTARPRFREGQKVTFVDESPLAGFIAEVAVDAGKEVTIFLEELAGRTIKVDPANLVAADPDKARSTKSLEDSIGRGPHEFVR